MEAMAQGKPLLVSDKGGLPELVEDSVNGYIFHSKEELGERLMQLVTLDERAYRKMCESSLERAKALFDPQKYVEKLLEYYQEIKK